MLRALGRAGIDFLAAFGFRNTSRISPRFLLKRHAKKRYAFGESGDKSNGA